MAEVLLTPLYNLENDSNVIHRIVRSNDHGGGDIETVLLRDEGGSQQRVVIRDRDMVHAEMEIQNDSACLDQKNRMCWTKFEDMDLPVLCVLSSPTQVRLWDSGSFLGGGEGTSIHLPCEATSIFALDTGILVQRRFMLDDNEDQEEDELVFLSKPAPQASPVASLFSIIHPLKPLLPVQNSSSMEQLLFVGVVDGSQVAVTFHVESKRHAVWIFGDAKPAPTQPQDVKVEPTAASFIVEEDLLAEETSFYENVPGVGSREEALADALGLGSGPIGGTTAISPFGMTALHPDLVMTRIYEAVATKSGMAQSIFLAGSFLCLSTRTELLLWDVSNKIVVPTATLPCSCGLPIQVTSESNLSESCILVLNDGIQLYNGGDFLVDVSFGGNAGVKLFRDPIESRFTLELENGSHLRVELTFALSPLTERVLTALQVSVGGNFALHARLDCVRLIPQHAANGAIKDPAWEALVYLLEQTLGTSQNSEPTSDSSCWNTLVQCEEYSDEAFPIFKVGRASSAKHYAPTAIKSDLLQSLHLSKWLDDMSLRTKVFDALHLLYEDLKLSVILTPWCQKILPLLKGSLNDSMTDFAAHYDQFLDSGSSSALPPHLKPGKRITSFARVPCITSWIINSLGGEGADSPPWLQLPVVSVAFPNIDVIQRAYAIMASSGYLSGAKDIKYDVSIVNALINGGLQSEAFLQDNFPIGVALPLLEVVARCRNHPCVTELTDVSDATWKFIGREDMLNRNLQGIAFENDARNMPTVVVDSDGLDGIEYSHALRFPNDNRLKEVSRLLRSSKPSFLKVPRAVELSDHDHERLKQERLLLLCQRVLALPLGRGMFTIGTLKPIPAEQLPIAELCLSGRVFPTNGNLALDMTSTPPEMTMWPEFHNGVAAGLRLPAAGSKSTDAFKITRSWIIYNKSASAANKTSESSQSNHSHGGLLMALGLRGHLSALSMTDVYEYLTQGSVTTSVGVLLGMAANKRGTCDPSVSKMLCLHIPSLLPPSFSSIDVSAPAHAAAVSGIGLLYQGSSHRLMTEFLLNEMGRRPVHDLSTIDREAYTLSCGLALGMINLAKGGSGGDAGLADLDIEQRLYRYVVGGIDDRAAYKRQDTVDRRLNSNGDTFGEGERCSRVYEGDAINNDVTAPGALIALGLMYMKSGNEAVAAGIALPDTHFLLDYSRPDTLMLKVLARSLILWDQVEPTSHWMDNQIPLVVRRTYLKMTTIVKKATGTVLSVVDQETTQETTSSNESHTGPEEDEQRETPADFQAEFDVDRQSVRQIHAYIIAGSCFSIGLRFAGTADAQAAKMITEKILEFKAFRDSNDPLPSALRPEQPVVGMCIGLCAISLALVMAGTGDLESLRLFKAIRWRSDGDIRHGAHMTVASAIGLLFVGGGLCTVGRSPADIAALVAAFFPRFPMNTTDNKYHLQALRHIYALAVQQRHVQAFDVDSKEGISVLVEAQSQESKVKATLLTTPNLLTNVDSKRVSLAVKSDIYFPTTVSIDDSNTGGFCIYLKKCKDVGDEAKPRNIYLDFATGKSHSQKLIKLLQNGQTKSRANCRCSENAKLFCCGNFLGCVSVPLSPDALPVSSLLGSLQSSRMHSLSSDILILQYYYQRFGYAPETHFFLAPDNAALIIEKLRQIVLSCPSWAPYLSAVDDTACMDIST